MGADGRLARVHLDRLADRAGFIRELFERELELPRIDAFGGLAKQALTEHIELMAQRRVLALDSGELLLQGGDERAGGHEIVDREVGHARLIHSRLYTITTRSRLPIGIVIRVTRRARTTAAAACRPHPRPTTEAADRDGAFRPARRPRRPATQTSPARGGCRGSKTPSDP